MKKPTPVPTPAPIIPVTQDSSGVGQGAGTQGGQGTQGSGSNPQDPLQVNKTPEDSMIISNVTTPGPVIMQEEVRIEKSTEESILTEKPVAQVIELPETPKAISNSAAEDDGSLIIGDNSTENIQSSVITETSSIPEVQTLTSEVVNSDNIDISSSQSLRDMQLNRMKNEGVGQILSSEDESVLNNLFGQIDDEEVKIPSIQGEIEAISTLTQSSQLQTDEVFENPIVFIESSIEKIDVIILQIETTHATKLGEAAGYKGEKERFANLESEAYADADKMMKEKAHADKMKVYFLNQKDHTDERFEHSLAFISSSLEKIEFMIAHIETTHAAKLEEAAGYKGEKERFANLESEAYADADKMMKEKAHAKKMKSYFLDQRNHSYEGEAKAPQESSVETTLTSLSVKNSVDEATKAHDPKKTVHKKVPNVEIVSK